MTFSNPITGGQGTLVRPAIKSPDYSPGVAGWTINRDGSAEFNDLTLRGVFTGTDFILNASGFFVYSGTPAAGNLVASIAPAAGTDGFGNSYIAGFATYGLDLLDKPITSQLLDGNVNLFPSDHPEFEPGGVQVTSLPDGNWRLILAPPADQVTPLGFPALEMSTESAVDAQDSQAWLFADEIDLFPEVRWRINGVEQGFGSISFTARQTDAGPVTTTETVAITSPDWLPNANRAYRIRAHCLMQSSVEGDSATVRVRKNDATGDSLLDSALIYIPAANFQVLCDMEVVIVTDDSPPINHLVLTFFRRVGSGNVTMRANASNPAYLQIDDIGAASDYPDARLLS